MTKKKTTKAVVKVEQATEAYKTKGKYSLVPSPLKDNQLLFVLQKTPTEHVHNRPGKGGKNFDYVTGVYIKKVLNHVFGWRWDFEVKDHGKEGGQVWVLGRLTIKNEKFAPIIIKEQFGAADVKILTNGKGAVSYGNDLKSASTDALKKCASELGIASDVYGKNEFKAIGAKIDNNDTNTHVVPKTTPSRPTAARKATTKSHLDQLKAKLFKMGAKTEKQAIALLEKKTGLVWKDFKNKTPKQTQIAFNKLLMK